MVLLEIFGNVGFIVVLFSHFNNEGTVFLLDSIIYLISGANLFESGLIMLEFFVIHLQCLFFAETQFGFLSKYERLKDTRGFYTFHDQTSCSSAHVLRQKHVADSAER